MFKDSPEGQTHYQNDGCGELAHNQQPKWEEEFDKFFELQFSNAHPAQYGVLKKFIRTHFISKEELREKIEGMEKADEQALDDIKKLLQ